jgi:CDP-diglyceride synthetase
MKTKINFKQAFMAGLMASGAAVVINAILFFIFRSAGVLVDTIFIQPNQPLTIVPIIISSILPTLVASVVFFLIEKYSNNGFKTFRIVSIVLLVLSFMNPFMGIQGVTTGYALVLNVMHVVVAGSILYFIGKAVKNNA